MKITPLNANVENAKMKAYSVELSNGKAFTFLSEVCSNVEEVEAAILERWPQYNEQGDNYDNK